MFKVKPLTGWGLLGVYFADPKLYLYHTREFHAHNIWITVLATMGVVGLGIYGYMRYNLYKTLKMLWDSKCRLVPLLLAIQAMVIGHGVVDFTVITPQGGIIFFGCSALTYALAIRYNDPSAHSYYSLHTLFNKRKTGGSFEGTQKI
jgi:O-antigen ligase